MSALLFVQAAGAFVAAAGLLLLEALGLRRIQRWLALGSVAALSGTSVLLLAASCPLQETYFGWLAGRAGAPPLAISFRLDDLSRVFQILPPLLALSAILATCFDPRTRPVSAESGESVREETPAPSGDRVDPPDRPEAADTAGRFSDRLRARLSDRASAFLALSHRILRWLRTPAPDAGPRTRRTHLLVLVLLGASETAILSGSLLLLYVAWEVFVLCGTLLILGHARRESGDEEMIGAVLVPHAAGFAMLVAVVMAGSASGSFDLAKAEGASVPAVSLYLVSAVALARMTFWALQAWPGVLSLPAPLIPLLSGGLAGWISFYVLARWTSLVGPDAHLRWMWPLAALAAVLIVVGALRALRHTHLATALSSIAVSQTALAFVALCLGGTRLLSGALLVMLAGTLLVTSLLLCAHTVEVAVGTQDTARMRGLANLLPGTATMFIGAAALVAGTPALSLSFLGQWLVYGDLLAGWRSLLLVAALAGSSFVFAALVRLGFSTFLGRALVLPGGETGDSSVPHPDTISLGAFGMSTAAGSALPFAIACLGGVLPWLVLDVLVGPAVRVVVGAGPGDAGALAVLLLSPSGWTAFLVPLPIVVSLAAGFAIYYQLAGRREGVVAVGTTGDSPVAHALTTIPFGPWRAERRMGLIASLAYVTLRGSLAAARLVGRLASAVEARYYVVAVLLWGLVTLFVQLE